MEIKNIRKLAYSALCLALSMTLPLLTGKIPIIGKMLCPMHFPVLVCGFICGWPYGIIVGFIAPIINSFVFGRPVFMPYAVSMAFELATYGFVSGFLYKLLDKKIVNIYISLIAAMLSGRFIWGISRYFFAGIQNTSFAFSDFIKGALTTAIPGIILQLIIIPILIMALNKAKLTNDME